MTNWDGTRESILKSLGVIDISLDSLLLEEDYDQREIQVAVAKREVGYLIVKLPQLIRALKKDEDGEE